MKHTDLEHNKQVVRRLYEECINHGKLAGLPELLADDFVGPSGERGPSGFGELITGLRTGMPDIHFVIEDMVAEGDRVSVRWYWDATHTGAFRGIPATHQRIHGTGMSLYDLRDGRVVRARVETDRLGVLQQMGAIPMDLRDLPAVQEAAAAPGD